MAKENITFACMATPHLNRLKDLLPKVLPYVNKAILVFGRKDKEAIEYIKSINVENKILLIYRPWDDNFANQWNAYLKFVKDGWIMVLDDDEIPSDNMLQSLEKYVDDSNFGNNYCGVEFKCNPISEGQDMGPCNYWRQIFFRYTPNLVYRGGTKTGLHQYIVGYQNNRLIRSDYVYYHIKSVREEHQNAARNWTVGGIWRHGATDGDRCEVWEGMWKIIKEFHPEVKVFPDLDHLLITDTINPIFKKWMVDTYNTYKNDSLYNECRAVCSYFFKFLHPEQAEQWGFIA